VIAMSICLVAIIGNFMKTIPSRFAPGLAAVAIAASACLAVATVVQAQTPPPPRSASADARPMPARPPGGPMMEHEGGHGMHMMREMGQFKAALQLNAQQSALWDKAVANMKPPADMREQMKARHERMTAMLNDPNFDPRKMAAEMDSVAAERKARMSSIREGWFAFYDSLNPMQRGQVREFLREKMMRGHHGHHGRGDMRGRMEWMQHRDSQGQPPMPPAPSSR
jgi:Spy/CpxP family protein refolding chaperone